MTNLNKVRLPHHRRYNWFMVSRETRVWRKVWMLAACVLIGLLVYMTVEYLTEKLRRMDTEQAHASLSADVFRLANFGALTRTDYEEGTTWIEVRKIK